MSVHVLPFMHGEEPHSSGLTSQLYPLKPSAQMQVYEKVWSKHVPLLRQGADEHSSSSDMQVPTGMSE